MAVFNVSSLLIGLPILYFLHSVFRFSQNYLTAHRTGLPILINPVNGLSPLWLLTKDYLTPIIRLLPAPLSSWTYRTDIGWNQAPKYEIHEKLKSSAFWLVDPTNIELYVADPGAAEEILRRSKTDFIKNPNVYGVLEVFGQSVNSVNGKTWERHRRITVPPFNENVSESVWEEAGRQVQGAKGQWFDKGVVRSTQEGCTRIALHVLTAAGFGMSYHFQDDVEGRRLPAGHRLNYRDAVRLILKNMGIVILVRMLQKVRWPLWVTWGRVNEVVFANGEFQTYMEEVLHQERKKIRNGEQHKENLMSVLVRSNDQAKSEGKATGLGLSDSEVFGNMFLYNLAGHDTTANTMAFALTQLAVMPQWQEWVAEELDAVLLDQSVDQENLRYADIFPKLPRCLALMYETLRLYGPVPALPRWTGSSWQKLTIDGKEISIPPDSHMIVNFAALHTHPSYWGPDPYDFRPDRWIVNQETSEPPKDDFDKDHPYDWQSASLLRPKPGTFIPWNGGPRVCPGKKFSQVEFVRVMAGLFSGGGRVKVLEEERESKEDARERAMRIAKEARVDFALKMQGSERIGLQWYQRRQV